MRIGLFGFPKVGKTTLFNTLTGSSIPMESYATGKPETHVGVALVPDQRLETLSRMFEPKKTTHARVEYLDIVGVEKGDAAGGETFLTELKNVDALLHVVRAFDDPNLPHGEGDIDPESDAARLPTAVADARLEPFAKRRSVAVAPVSARIEMEIARLGPEDARAFQKDMGIEEPALDRVIRSSYELLGLISFFTVGEDECRAWTIHRGTNAHRAAGAIHSDIERGFIRAEVIPYETLVSAGSWNASKDKGQLRLEGKEYVVQDGDTAHFRFNV